MRGLPPGSPSQPHQAKTTSGPLDRVVCPNCGHKNDMRELPQQQLLDTGSTYECDACKRLMQVVGIQVVTVVTVRPAPPTSGQPVVRTLGAAATRRLLKGR